MKFPLALLLVTTLSACALRGAPPAAPIPPTAADTADAKLAVMEECGFTVTRNPSEMGKLLKGLL